MAVTILGNVTVTGVTFASGDINNYVLTSTGAGDTIKGEGNLTFDGTTLVITGAETISGNASVGGTLGVTGNSTLSGTLGVTGLSTLGSASVTTTLGVTGLTTLGAGVNVTGTAAVTGNISATGTISADTISAGTTVNVLNYNDGTGAITYNASGGGTTNYLRADGTWATPSSSLSVSGTPVDDQLAVWTNATTLEGDAGLTWNGSELLSDGDLRYTGIFKEPVVVYSGAIGSSPEEPAAGTKFINIEPMTGSVYDLIIDLDNLEYVNNNAVVHISYEWQNNLADLSIRNSLNEVMQTIVGAPATLEGGWLFEWDYSNARWNSITVTSH